MQGFLYGVSGAFLALSVTCLQAQNSDNQIRVRIDAQVDGQQVHIDTAIDNLSDLNLDQYLQELGVEDELNQLNIDINTHSSGQFWDQAAFEEMMRGLEDLRIEIPAIPSIPDIPTIPDVTGIMSDELANADIFYSNKALLGVFTEKTQEGARITSLSENSAAAEAGLQDGDIITMIDKRTIESPSNLSEVIGMYNPGDIITVTFLREGKEMTAKATLKENTNSFDFSGYNFNWNDSSNGNPFVFDMAEETHGFLGVYLEDGDDAVVITGVEEGSAAEKAGLQEGDILLEINNNKMRSYDDVVDFMAKTKPGEKVSITYERAGKKKTTDAELKESNNTYFFNFNGDEGYLMPNIDIMPATPCPPGSVYSYNSGDGKKVVSICITAEQGKEGADETDDAASHPLLNTDNLKVFSNPSNGTFQVQFSLPEEGNTYVTINDFQGKEVYTETLMNFSGNYDRTISLGKEVAKGTYFVKVSQNGYSSTKTVVIQ